MLCILVFLIVGCLLEIYCESAAKEIAFKAATKGTLVLTYTEDSFGGDKVKFVICSIFFEN